MPLSRLTALQQQILSLLGRVDPPPVLTGGAALAGFHTFHRTTRDLDLFWRGRKGLGDLPRSLADTLTDAGMSFEVLQSAPSFQRLKVVSGTQSCIVDLVADPVTAIEEPQSREIGGTRLLVDSAYEILVNKLTTLLSRSEVRDLEDVRVLLEAGGDLARALNDAARKDGGFSPLTLAWVLEGFAAGKMAMSLGWPEPDARRVEDFRLELIPMLLEG